MLDELKIDELLEKVDSRYGLALATAKRARQINEYTATLGLNDSLGIPGPQVHTRSQHPLTIALEELRAGKLRIGLREPGSGEGEPGAAGSDDFLSAGSAPSNDAETDPGQDTEGAA